MVRNTDPNSTGTEYHFSHESNGWVTTKAKGEVTGVMGPYGQAGVSPVLCDQESTKKRVRIDELKFKAKGQELTEAESRELLLLCGIIKG